MKRNALYLFSPRIRKQKKKKIFLLLFSDFFLKKKKVKSVFFGNSALTFSLALNQ
uniref:Uncharacterized protein n=1 Tax=Chlorella vulgaris TaxID=3077 RepID=V9H153_CHLVU|nr:hypothetical protein ChvulCp097 [Chlorella vulgaris]pir/T07284/ hypothetical protein 54c - Chlorella vulgaris chloroplast [Chlorella vulgaris]BAA57932.1 unnamed protein product [Chlorella vulgaris]